MSYLFWISVPYLLLLGFLMMGIVGFYRQVKNLESKVIALATKKFELELEVMRLKKELEKCRLV